MFNKDKIKNVFTISVENYLMFCKVDILLIIERKMRDEEVEVWKILIANSISRLRKKISAQNKPECPRVKGRTAKAIRVLERLTRAYARIMDGEQAGWKQARSCETTRRGFFSEWGATVRVSTKSRSITRRNRWGVIPIVPWLTRLNDRGFALRNSASLAPLRRPSW